MSRKKPLTSHGVQKLTERERQAGLEPDDEAARWLEQHDPEPEPQRPKAASKSKHLHRWRQQNPRG
jgi:hypothetical protein